MTGLRGLRAAGNEAGYTVVELMTTLVVMSIVLTGLTTLFVQGSNAEIDMNNRFRAQTEARLGLDKIPREGHTACAAVTTPGSAAAWSVTFKFRTTGTTCSTSTNFVTWCTRAQAGSTTRFGLWRVVGSSCGTSGGARYADFLTPTTGAPTCGSPLALCVFTFTSQSTTTLAKLRVDFPVNPDPRRTVNTYELVDDIVLRNSCRVAGACTT